MSKFTLFPARTVIFVLLVIFSLIDQPFIQNSVVPVILTGWFMLLFDEIFAYFITPDPFDLFSATYFSSVQ